mmetsp:Transcript_37633/g.98176  ORF Transcript_37633/g.98176 Transcript_37633/m.98176 type:complete len:218 (-) Transcript_37633:130-783(-)
MMRCMSRGVIAPWLRRCAAHFTETSSTRGSWSSVPRRPPNRWTPSLPRRAACTSRAGFEACATARDTRSCREADGPTRNSNTLLPLTAAAPRKSRKAGRTVTFPDRATSASLGNFDHRLHRVRSARPAPGPTSRAKWSGSLRLFAALAAVCTRTSSPTHSPLRTTSVIQRPQGEPDAGLILARTSSWGGRPSSNGTRRRAYSPGLLTSNDSPSRFVM